MEEGRDVLIDPHLSGDANRNWTEDKNVFSDTYLNSSMFVLLY